MHNIYVYLHECKLHECIASKLKVLKFHIYVVNIKSYVVSCTKCNLYNKIKLKCGTMLNVYGKINYKNNSRNVT